MLPLERHCVFLSLFAISYEDLLQTLLAAVDAAMVAPVEHPRSESDAPRLALAIDSLIAGRDVALSVAIRAALWLVTHEVADRAAALHMIAFLAVVLQKNAAVVVDAVHADREIAVVDHHAVDDCPVVGADAYARLVGLQIPDFP